MVVIDAQDAIVGRLGAAVSKMLLAGKEVMIVNPEKALMKGSLINAKQKYLSRRSQKNKRKPEHSPVWPRVPHLLLRRIIRGMLPWDSKRGKDAYRRLKVMPGGFQPPQAPQPIPEAIAKDKQGTFTLEELCLQLGFQKKRNL
ncbi:MAG: 50S ribosomal protein L13 [Candidatus Micrarchaeota archaeon]|nr:50S ribosomal protein L13 [Candidatus Micrarchaeota archaeon]